MDCLRFKVIDSTKLSRASTAASTAFWRPEGISLGRRRMKAIENKKRMIAQATRSVFVTGKLPIWKSGSAASDMFISLELRGNHREAGSRSRENQELRKIIMAFFFFITAS